MMMKMMMKSLSPLPLLSPLLQLATSPPLAPPPGRLPLDHPLLHAPSLVLSSSPSRKLFLLTFHPSQTSYGRASAAEFRCQERRTSGVKVRRTRGNHGRGEWSKRSKREGGAHSEEARQAGKEEGGGATAADLLNNVDVDLWLPHRDNLVLLSASQTIGQGSSKRPLAPP